MASAPRPHDDDVASVLSTYPNYLSRRTAAPAPDGRGTGGSSRRAVRPFNPWLVAVLAYLMGTVAVLLAAFVLVFVFLVVCLSMQRSGSLQGMSRFDLVALAVLSYLALTGLGIIVQALFIRRWGGSRPWLGPATAAAVGTLVATALEALSVPVFATMLLVAPVEIAVLARLIRRWPATANRVWSG